jgi:hypothetical protein
VASRVVEEVAYRHEDRHLCDLVEEAHLVVHRGVDFRVCFQDDGDRSDARVEGRVDLVEVAFLAWATCAWILTSPVQSLFPILGVG